MNRSLYELKKSNLWSGSGLERYRYQVGKCPSVYVAKTLRFSKRCKRLDSFLHSIWTWEGAEFDFAKRFPTVKAIQLVANLRTPHISRGIHIQNLANYLAELSA